MTNPRILIDESDRGPEPPHLKRERELYERYYRTFKEDPPSFGLPTEDDQARLARIEQAFEAQHYDIALEAVKAHCRLFGLRIDGPGRPGSASIIGRDKST